MTTTSIPFRSHMDAGTRRPGGLRSAGRKLRVLGLRGIGLALLHRLTGRVSLTQLQLPGLPHPVYLRIGTRDFRDYWRAFEDQELAFDLRGPRVIVDGGSGAGFSALWFASRYPMATVYAIEMERSNFAVLDLNSAPYLNIVPARAAISGQMGKLIIPNPGRGHWGFRLTDAPEGGQTVTGITMGRLLDHYNLDRVDVLKLDIDMGLADEVFEDGSNWVHRVDTIVAAQRMNGEAFTAATAGFPVRWQRGSTRHLSRY